MVNDGYKSYIAQRDHRPSMEGPSESHLPALGVEAHCTTFFVEALDFHLASQKHIYSGSIDLKRIKNHEMVQMVAEV
jgi:hypothetical protein